MISRPGQQHIVVHVMEIDTAAVDDAALALFYLTLHDCNRARKSIDWDAMNRLGFMNVE